MNKINGNVKNTKFWHVSCLYEAPLPFFSNPGPLLDIREYNLLSSPPSMGLSEEIWRNMKKYKYVQNMKKIWNNMKEYEENMKENVENMKK